MAGAGDEIRFIEFQDLERYKTERRCMHCKTRTFDEMVTCTKCLEFRVPASSTDATPKEADGKVEVDPASRANQALSKMNATSASSSADATSPAQASGMPASEVKERSATSSSEPGGKVKERSPFSSSEPTREVNERSATRSGQPAIKVKERSASCTNGASSSNEVISDAHNPQDAEYQPTGGELMPYEQERAEEATSAAGGRDSEKPPVLEKCHFCGNESYSMLKCSRCLLGRYCSKICQKKDFPRHKESCRRGGRFLVALGKIPRPLLVAPFLGLRIPLISVLLSDVSEAFEYKLIGPKRSILLEIVDMSVFVFQYSARAVDRDGTMCRIIFQDPSGIYSHVPNGLIGFSLPVPLQRCLKPGILLAGIAAWTRRH